MELILYHRDGCHLCDQLEEAVLEYARQRGVAQLLSMVHRDIDAQPAWRELYGDRIPVLTFDGAVILEGNPASQDIARALDQLDWRQ